MDVGYKHGLFSLFISTFFFIHGGQSHKLMGCYRDISISNRLLTGIKSDFPGKLTIEICINNCKLNGYRYAGVEFRKECFCSSDRPSYKYLADEEDCSSPCDGNPQQTCGGNYRLNVYDIEDEETKNEVAQLYQGCFEDSESNRLLPNTRKDTDLLIPEYCVGYCHRRGYRYAGLQYGKECYCGDTLEQGRKVRNDDCSLDCKGDKSMKCGGNWKLSVYKTGISNQKIEDGSYLGCFKDNNEEFRVLSAVKFEMKETNTPERCLNMCHSEGFKYSGTEYRIECFCGNRRPSPTKEYGEDKCRMTCPGDKNQLCGGEWSLQVYSTGKGEEKPDKPQLTSLNEPEKPPPDNRFEPQSPTCQLSKTYVNGKRACNRQVIFSEDFKGGRLDFSKWSHSVLIPTVPNYEFVIYTNNPENSYVENERLIIEPTLQSDEFVSKGNIVLSNCTGQQFSEECEGRAKSIYILPPVATAKLHTRNFSFRYGVVEILARLPIGDWILPVIWLEPTWRTYGPGLTSGRINIASAVGNKRLKTCKGEEIGSQILSSGVLVAYGENIKEANITRKKIEGWSSGFHNYTFVWTPNSLSFIVDGEDEEVLFPSGSSSTLTSFLGFDPNELKTWNTGSSIAPLDQEFQLTLGLTVGGMRGFPDGSESGDNEKPWSDWNVRAKYNFWKAKSQWHPTWSQPLEIESVKITAL